MSMLEHALNYATEYGWKVFPLVQGGKTPLTSHGFHDATIDTEQIIKWWTKYPNANIGVSTDDFLCVVDVDMHNSDGLHSMQEWEAKHGDIGNTLVAKTGNGGRHYYFMNTLQVKSAVNVLPGVDLRAKGGYVVAPPSVLDGGKTYEWLNEAIPSRPTLSSAELMKLPSQSSRASESNGMSSQGTFQRAKVNEGRNNYLTSYMGYISKANPNASIERLEQLILRVNEEDCQPPLDEPEIRRTIFKSLKKVHERDAELAKQDVMELGEWETEEDVDDSLEDVEEIPTRWLVDKYIPESSYTLLVGDGGVGKTTIWCSIAASVSNGKMTFLDCRGHFNLEKQYDSNIVCFLSAEDSVPRVLKRRLRQAGANVKNIHCIDMDNEHFSEYWIGSKKFEEWIAKWRPALCILDPIQSFIDPTIDMSKRNSMRHALRPLSQLGSKYGTSFLVVVHTNKSQTSWGRARMADSSDIWDQARSVLMVGHANDDAHNLYISHEKSNYGANGETVLFGNADGVIFNNGTSPLKDKDFVSKNFKASKSMRETSALNDAKDLIMMSLSENPDGIPSAELKNEIVEEFGVSKVTYERAYKELRTNGQIESARNEFQGKYIIRKK